MINNIIKKIDPHKIIGFCTDCGFKHILGNVHRCSRCNICDMYVESLGFSNKTCTLCKIHIQDNKDDTKIIQSITRQCVICKIIKSPKIIERVDNIQLSNEWTVPIYNSDVLDLDGFPCINDWYKLENRIAIRIT